MSKAHRGKGIRDQFARGRGVCPVCQRSNVKILYEQESAGQKIKICKVCRASIKNGKKKLPGADVAAVQEPKVAEAPKAAEPAAEPVKAAEPAAEPAVTEDSGNTEETTSEE